VLRANLLALIPSCFLLTIAVVLVSVATMAWERNPAALLLFLNGTGVSDTAAHSVIQRESAFSDTLTVFTEHPLIGESLGGVSSGIAALHAYTVRSFEDSKPFEGMNIFAEALAASGIAGIAPFIWFLIETTAKPLNIAKRASPLDSALIRALVRALLFAWAILQFNQNILRPYLWVHLAVLAAVCAAAQRLEAPQDARIAGMC
jgi:O-antigen ligase